MTKRNKQLEYSCVIFYSFAISFFILGIVNIVCPISNFKMTILSVVAVLLSLQQLFEASEDVDDKISDLEKNAANQGDLLDLINPPLELPPTPTSERSTHLVSTSQWIFAVAMVVLIVGLSLDVDFQYSIIANTATIISFAVIFLTMGYKERFAMRINLLNEEQHVTNQRIISKLKNQINPSKKS